MHKSRQLVYGFNYQDPRIRMQCCNKSAGNSQRQNRVVQGDICVSFTLAKITEDKIATVREKIGAKIDMAKQ